MHDVITGKKYWSPKGQWISVPYTWSHKKITVYGSVALDGQQFFRTYDKFYSPTFVCYLKETQKRFGKVAIIADRAPQHRSIIVKELLLKNKNIRIIYGDTPKFLHYQICRTNTEVDSNLKLGINKS